MTDLGLLQETAQEGLRGGKADKRHRGEQVEVALLHCGAFLSCQHDPMDVRPLHVHPRPLRARRRGAL